MAQVHRFLNRLDEFVVLIRRVIAENIHVKAGTFLDHGKPDATSPDDRDGLACDFITQEWQVRMPESPLVFAREMFGAPQLSRQRPKQEECEFSRRFGEHVGGVCERNLVAIGVGAIDVVETNRKLSHNF